MDAWIDPSIMPLTQRLTLYRQDDALDAIHC